MTTGKVTLSLWGNFPVSAPLGLTADLQTRTRVIVAHRLASIRHANRVLFVDNGAVVEDCSIDELLTAGGRFDEFWRQQHAAADWQITH